jgi:hypothetical protein
MSDDQPASSWRSSIAQSYRSSEVRSIATVLAELEPGATSASKTMLAMRFEESIFKAASSLDDYKKSIEKRLKKLRKHYSKQQSVAGGDTANDELTREKERLLENEIRETFGDKMLYIVEKSDLAVRVLNDKKNEKSAQVLADHSQKVKHWCAVLGILPNTPKEKKDLDYLIKLKSLTEKIIDNIRDHITKICDPEIFISDAFTKLDEQFNKEESMSDMLRKAFQDQDPDNPQFNPQDMKRLMEKMNAPLPIPRKNEEAGGVKVALAKIERFRSAVAALYIFWGLSLGDKTAFPGCLKKSLDMAFKCLLDLETVYDSLVKKLDDTDENGKRVIQLQDAWNNTMQFVEIENDTSLDIDEPETKRQKTEDVKHPIVLCSRVLLSPGRAVMPSILPVLKRKRAMLVRNKTSPHVVLQFGKAFEMKIYFAPLLVTIRAMAEKEEGGRVRAIGESLKWPSLHQGLHPSQEETKDLTVLGVTSSHETLGHVAAKKLEYASSQATLVLRRCFAETVIGKGALAKTDFEVEILEVGALVKFLQIARSTFQTDWVDDD